MLYNKKYKFCKYLVLQSLFNVLKVCNHKWRMLLSTFIGIHLCSSATSLTFLVMGHYVKRWSTVSISSARSRNLGSILQPLFKRTPLTGRALWHIYHIKTLSLGIVSTFQIQLQCHSGHSYGQESCANYVAVLVLNVPELVQQNESLMSIIGIAIPIIFWIIGW